MLEILQDSLGRSNASITVRPANGSRSRSFTCVLSPLCLFTFSSIASKIINPNCYFHLQSTYHQTRNSKLLIN